MYLVGVLPALITLWVWRTIPESPRWEHSHARRREAYEMRRRGAVLAGEHAALARFTMEDLFSKRSVRDRLIAACVLMLSATLGSWH